MITEALQLTGKEKTLEIGTDSGYQAAILAELGYDNILFKAFDGTLGSKEYEPYDVITFTAGAPKIPRHLLDQMADGGRLTIPVGNKFSQDLITGPHPLPTGKDLRAVDRLKLHSDRISRVCPLADCSHQVPRLCGVSDQHCGDMLLQ